MKKEETEEKSKPVSKKQDETKIETTPEQTEKIVESLTKISEEIELLRGKAIVTVDNAERIDEAKECLKDAIEEINDLIFKK